MPEKTEKTDKPRFDPCEIKVGLLSARDLTFVIDNGWLKRGFSNVSITSPLKDIEGKRLFVAGPQAHLNVAMLQAASAVYYLNPGDAEYELIELGVT